MMGENNNNEYNFNTIKFDELINNVDSDNYDDWYDMQFIKQNCIEIIKMIDDYTNWLIEQK